MLFPRLSPKKFYVCIAELHPQIPCYFPRQPSAQVSQTLRSHTTAVTT
jgi:hypothetical protein